MVTPKILYTKPQAEKLLSNAIVLADSYRRDYDLEIRMSIRYDPDIERISLGLTDIMEYNYGRFFLLQLHYKQLKYTMKCLRWNTRLSYSEFIRILNTLLVDSDLDTPLIIHLTMSLTGEVSANIEQADPVDSMFAGLMDHLHVLDLFESHAYRKVVGVSESSDESSDIDDVDDMFDDTKLSDVQLSTTLSEETIQNAPRLEPSSASNILYIDSEPTLPSYYTSFDTTNLGPYIDSHLRVSALYLSMLKEKYPIKENVNYNDDDDFEQIIFDDNCNEWDEKDDRVATPSIEDQYKALELVGDEVIPLMYNTVHQIMCGGHEWIIAVYRKGGWFTPHLGSGCRNDPLRMLLLRMGIIKEEFLLLQGLTPGEDVLLISSSQGIQRGCIIGEMPQTLYKYTRSRVKQRAQEKKQKTKEKQKTKFLLSEWMNLPNGRPSD